jgi:hypothetical protein
MDTRSYTNVEIGKIENVYLKITGRGDDQVYFYVSIKYETTHGHQLFPIILSNSIIEEFNLSSSKEVYKLFRNFEKVQDFKSESLIEASNIKTFLKLFFKKDGYTPNKGISDMIELFKSFDAKFPDDFNSKFLIGKLCEVTILDGVIHKINKFNINGKYSCYTRYRKNKNT